MMLSSTAVRLRSPEDQVDHKVGVYIRESTKYKFESEWLKWNVPNIAQIQNQTKTKRFWLGPAVQRLGMMSRIAGGSLRM
jgi:hypothetical protein